MSPASAADAVDVERRGVTTRRRRRAMRAAIVPGAEAVVDVRRTATPAAHEQSIASSAVSPPSAAP